MGTPSNAGNEASEDIEVVIADKAMVKKILKEEIVTIRGAYLLINYCAFRWLSVWQGVQRK